MATKRGKRGGRRPGAGRPKWGGKYGEPTTPVRIPTRLVSRLPELIEQLDGVSHEPTIEGAIGGVDQLHLLDGGREQLGDRRRTDLSTPCPRPLLTSAVAAGFPSPAEDYVEGMLSLDELLIRHPAATFHLRVTGESMSGAGIYPGDIVVVDRSLEHRNGSIVIAVVDGEMTVKRFQQQGQQAYLMPENPDYPPLLIKEEMEVWLWGVVVGVVRSLEG